MKVRTQIQFEEGQYRRLKAAARASGVSLSEVVRRLVSQHLEPKGDVDARASKAFAFVGCFADSEADVSERHDHYLDLVD